MVVVVDGSMTEVVAVAPIITHPMYQTSQDQMETQMLQSQQLHQVT
jgi:hypothetical protein